MQKQCSICKEFKDESEFSWKNKAQGKRHSQCKLCKREIDRRYYRDNENRRKSIRVRQDKQADLVKNYIKEVKQKSCCSKCGESRWYVLDFHHLRDKNFNISHKMRSGNSLETMQKELAKCIILCSNCHRELHYLETHSDNFTESLK